LDVPVFVVSHTVPQEWVYEGSTFTFVPDGLESALEQAKAVAGDKDVGVVGASLVQQCIRAGLLDEIHDCWSCKGSPSKNRTYMPSRRVSTTSSRSSSTMRPPSIL
jgi:dihydrofolate reductase